MPRKTGHPLIKGVTSTDHRTTEIRTVEKTPRHDHKYEPGAYDVCKRCGDSKENHKRSGTL